MASGVEHESLLHRRCVAVVGGRGFIGTPLVETLIAEGYRVRLLTRGSGDPHPQVEYVLGDLLRPASDWAPALLDGAAAVVSVAGELRNPDLMARVNGDAPVELLTMATDRGLRGVHVSTVGVYGRVSTGVVDEARKLKPRGHYEVTKAQADRALLLALRSSRSGAVILRPSIVFGPGMPGALLHRLAEAVSSARFRFIGPPGRIANLIWVGDVVEAILSALTPRVAPGVRAYNVSDELLWEDVVAELAAARGVRVPDRRLPAWPLRLATLPLSGSSRFGYLHRAVTALSNGATYSTARIRSDLGWSPRVGVRAGLRRLFGAEG